MTDVQVERTDLQPDGYRATHDHHTIRELVDKDAVLIQEDCEFGPEDIVDFMKSYTSVSVEGYTFVDDETGTLDLLIVKDIFVEGELTKEEIVRFFQKFAGRYETEAVWYKEDTGQVKLNVHFE